jgi:transposase
LAFAYVVAFRRFLYRRRLNDFRRIATRYELNAAHFLAAVCIAATVSYWL